MEFITKELTLLISLAFSTSIGLLVSSTTSTLTDKIFDICKKQPSQATYEMVNTTYLSALTLAILLSAIANFKFTQADPWDIFILSLMFIILTPLIWTEHRKASKWAILSEHSPQLEFKETPPKPKYALYEKLSWILPC